MFFLTFKRDRNYIYMSEESKEMLRFMVQDIEVGELEGLRITWISDDTIEMNVRYLQEHSPYSQHYNNYYNLTTSYPTPDKRLLDRAILWENRIRNDPEEVEK